MKGQRPPRAAANPDVALRPGLKPTKGGAFVAVHRQARVEGQSHGRVERGRRRESLKLRELVSVCVEVGGRRAASRCARRTAALGLFQGVRG